MGNISTTIEQHIVINRVIGAISKQSVVQYIEDNIQHWLEKSVIWDVSRADLKHFSTPDWIGILREAQHLAAKRAGEKTALVSPDNFAFGMIRMLESMADVMNLPLRFRSFRDIDQALAWIKDES